MNSGMNRRMTNKMYVNSFNSTEEVTYTSREVEIRIGSLGVRGSLAWWRVRDWCGGLPRGRWILSQIRRRKPHNLADRTRQAPEAGEML